MTRLGLAALALLLSAGHAVAAEWTVDPASSRLGFSGTQGGAAFSGTFKTFTAQITYDPAQPPAARAVVTIDLASASTGDAQRDTALPQPEWFNVAGFPQARFESAGFVAKGGDAFETHGKLTIRGVSADVTLPFTLTMSGDTAHAVGHAELLRGTFGVGQGPWANGDMVGLKVGVDIDLVAHKRP